MGLFSKKPKQPAPLPHTGPKPPPPGAVVLAPDAQAARDLDAADGHLDGKYFGAPIYQKPPPGSMAQSAASGYGPGSPYGAPLPQTHYPPPPAYPPRQYAEPVYHSRSNIEVDRPMMPYSSVSRQSYGNSPYGGGFYNEPMGSNNYGGRILSVDYVVHGAGYQGGPPSGGYAPTYTSGYGYQQPASCCAPSYGGYGSGIRSYPQPSRYEERYDGPPRYTPPPQPPRYTPPAPAPHFDVPSPFHDVPQTVPPPAMVDPNLRPWFGVALKWLDDLDQGGKNNVAVVHEVIPDSPAWKAGIQVDDQLEYWENTKIDSEAVWKSKVSQIRIGDVVNMGIHRAHRDQRVLVRIEGTTRDKGPKRMVQSTNVVHTDN